MKALYIVENMLDSDVPLGPPEPDHHQKAVGSLRSLRDLHVQASKKMIELDQAIQIERQLKKHGITKDQVRGYLRPQPDYRTIPRKGGIPPDAIIGLETVDGRTIKFDFPVIVPK